MFRIGLNPYGIAYALGIHASGTARQNPSPLTLSAYLDLARELGVRGVEIHHRHLEQLNSVELRQLQSCLEERGWFCIVASPLWEAPVSLELARAVGAKLVRVHLTPVLCGDRADAACGWTDLVGKVRSDLGMIAARARDSGMRVGIEDHQDFTSLELLELCDHAGENVGVTLDTANPLSVGECPVAFARRVAARVIHVHLKDYWPHWTDEGYRLIRCPVGDGCVPFGEIATVLDQEVEIPATIEMGALCARHIRLLTPEWWRHYPEGHVENLPAALLAARRCRLAEESEWRTPWELEKNDCEIMEYEMRQLRRSVENVRKWNWV